MKRHPPGSVVHFVFDRYLLLPLGVLVALVWANAGGESYFVFSHRLSFAVNEIGMAIFLGLVTQEIMEATLPGGALHTWRRWSLPLFAAAGGIIGSACVYLAYVNFKYELVLASGWPAVTAVDIAAGYFTLKMIFRRGSPAYPFLLLVAIVTNGFALLALAVRSDAGSIVRGGGALVLGAIALAAAFRALNVRSFWPYLVACGTLSWFGLYWAGVHPALALMPIVPFMPHEPRGVDLLVNQPADPHDTTRYFEHEWGYVVQPVVLLFGLVNGGVLLSGYGTGTWASVAGALVGRPVGIILAVALASEAGFHLPAQLRWRELTVVALATSTGFTLSLFAATIVFPIGALQGELKLGALFGVAGALAALVTARLLHAGRFERRAVGRDRPPHPRLRHAAGTTIFAIALCLGLAG